MPNTSWLSARSAILPLLFVVATTVMLASRIACAGTDPVAWLHVGVGTLALCALVLMRRSGLARATAYAFAIECAGGVVLFALIDAPAVLSNTPLIVRAVATVAPNGWP